MNPCPQCGAIPQTSDKFCNVCGNVLMQQGGGGYPGAPPPQYGGQPQPGFGAPPGYPPQQGGYPIEQQNYGAPTPDAYGQPQYPPQPGYGQAQGGYPAPGYPPQQQQGYGGYPDPNAAPAGFGPNYGGPQYPPQQQGGFPPPAPGGYDAPQGGAGYPPPAPAGQGGFPPPLPAQGAGAAVAPMPAAAVPEGPLPPQALRGFIVSYQANTTGDFWPLHGGRKTVGRANSGEGVDIPISDATVSSKHAAFNVDGTSGAIVVEDTGSTNGTYVNDEHIGFNGRRDLRDGDRVRFGGFTTIVKLVGR